MSSATNETPDGVDDGVKGSAIGDKHCVAGFFHVLKQIESGLVGLVRETVCDTIEATGCIATTTVNAARDVLKSVVNAVGEIGGNFLQRTTGLARGIVVGVGRCGKRRRYVDRRNGQRGREGSLGNRLRTGVGDKKDGV